MRLIFASVGAYGHMIPLLPLALAARDGGHEVAFATDEKFHSLLFEAGLDPISAGTTVSEAIGAVVGPAPRAAPVDAAPRAFGSFLARRAIADLAPVLAARKPGLVVYEVLNPGAGIAARLAGVPAVCHGIGRVSGEANWKAMSDAWVATAEEFGVDVSIDNPRFFGNPYLDICPPSLQLPEIVGLADRIPLRPVSWNQHAELPPFVKERDTSRSLVYLTFGTAFGRAEVLRKVIDGLSRLSVDVIVSAGRKIDRSEIGEVPAHIVVEEWVPQGDLLPHVDLVVSHGGSGTTLETLAHGLPHLVIPQGADQFNNARVISDAEVGRRILPADLTPEAVCEQAGALLDDQGASARASELAREIAGMPSPQEIAERLADLVG